jgi:hypothetical protein
LGDFWFNREVMNTSLVKTKPQGDYVAVSVLVTGWQEQFGNLIREKRPICYDMYPFQTIPPEFQTRLRDEGYSDLVPENDRWEHYLVPK